MRYVGCLLLALSAALLLGVSSSRRFDAPTACQEYEFQCANKAQCVYRWQMCDGKRDCQDGSDESAAACPTNFDCSEYGAMNCPSSKVPARCISREKACNNAKDCPDGSEEKPSFCKGFQCSTISKATCPSGVGCMERDAVCNGKKDCADGSDEDPKLCLKFNCSSIGKAECPADKKGKKAGVCISWADLCNGKSECPGGTDEDKAYCSAFKCDTNTNRVSCPGKVGCVWPFQVCDGQKDCADGSDEGAKYCKAYDCGPDRAKCPGGQQCVYGTRNLCDGRKDCKDGSDEAPKYCAKFNCSADLRVPCPTVKGFNPQCGFGYMYCDGNPDCPGGGDETQQFCETWKCTEGTIKCPGKGPKCVRGAFCDGYGDCADPGEDPATIATRDEDPGFCRSYQCPEGQIKCADGLQCIDPKRRCDGARNCRDGSDEDPAFCESFDCTADGRVFCPSGKYCLYDYCNVCRSRDSPDCPDGSDQADEHCGLYDNEACRDQD